MPDSFTIAYRVEITSLAARYRLPAVYPYRSFAEVGGLLSSALAWPTIFGERRPTSIASSRARNRASFPSRPQSSSSW
jgi:hypothetical protein